MFEYIRGQVVDKSPTHVVLDAGGIGYRLFIPVSTYDKIPADGNVTLLVHLYVREDQMKLYGFATGEERDLFELLMSVQGVGAATALMILSSNTVESIQDAIVEGQVDILQRIKGIGKKTAQRIVLELKGYLEQIHAPAGAPGAKPEAFHDAVLALVKLGYARRAAEQAVQKAEGKLNEQAAIEEVIRESLKHI